MKKKKKKQQLKKLSVTSVLCKRQCTIWDATHIEISEPSVLRLGVQAEVRDLENSSCQTRCGRMVHTRSNTHCGCSGNIHQPEPHNCLHTSCARAYKHTQKALPHKFTLFIYAHTLPAICHICLWVCYFIQACCCRREGGGGVGWWCHPLAPFLLRPLPSFKESSLATCNESDSPN